jgi:hypothetical protein
MVKHSRDRGVVRLFQHRQIAFISQHGAKREWDKAVMSDLERARQMWRKRREKRPFLAKMAPFWQKNWV